MNKLSDFFTDFETNSFFLFYLLCKYRFIFYSRNRIEKYQKRRIKKTVKYAIDNSAFFNIRFKGLDVNNFSSFPTTNKKEMMDNLTDYNTVGLTKDEILNFCLKLKKPGILQKD